MFGASDRVKSVKFKETLNKMRLNTLTAIAFLVLLIGCQQQSSSDDLKGFQIDPQFNLHLAAAEPLVFDPVDMEFDEHGDAYVLEMPGYPLSDRDSRLILLRDDDEDGLFDERIVYADSLGVASSFLPYQDGMLIAAPPNLLWLKDNDGDKRADERQVILSGFAVDNLQHNFNGLTYGLDNWIYAANGGNDGEPYFISQPEAKVKLNGGDVKFNLATQQLERFGESSGGFELTFDQWGRLFENHNIEAISHLIFEDRYLADLSVEPSHALSLICEPDETGYTRIYPIGEQETRLNHPEQSGYFSGACGITFYGGGAFPESYNNQLFVADVVLNLIHMGVLQSNGSSFKTTRKQAKSEFLAFTDRAFRPVNMAVGPDGGLYVLDMHRTVIEHPEWIPDEVEVNLDLNSGKQKGRIYKVSWKKNVGSKKMAYNFKDPMGLVQALESPNQWTRITAQRLLVEQQNTKIIPQLKQCMTDHKQPLTRLHAMWTLEGLSSLSDTLLNLMLTDPTDGVRENAIKLVESRLHKNTRWLPKLLELTLDEYPRVRLQATLAISTMLPQHHKEFGPQIAQAMFKLLEHPETDEWQTLAIIAALKQQPQLFGQQLLAGRTTLTNKQEKVALALARIIGKRHDVEGAKALIVNLSNSRRELQAALLESIALGWEKSPSNKLAPTKGLENQLVSLENKNDRSLIRASAYLRKALGLDVSPQMNNFIHQALQEITDANTSQEERLTMLKLIALAPYEQRSEALFAMLDNTQPIVLQREALLQLSQLSLPEVGNQLIQRWPYLGAEARKHASDILLYNTNHHPILLSAVENDIVNLGELNLDLERRRALLFSDDPRIKKRAEALFSDAGVVKRQDVIKASLPALSLAGQIEKGKQVYESICSGCHRFGNIGQNVGPNLTEIQRKSKETLLYEMLDPNSAVDTRYLTYKVTTKSGNIHSGIIERENDEEIVLRNIGGTEFSILKTEINSFSSLGISLMPEGLESSMTHQDIADLLAFLLQLNET